jgi:hypothetical protein
MTPIWVTLLVVILGLIGTAGGVITGVVISQRQSDIREKAAWQRERERERERWVREDAARTFDMRRDRYVAFYIAADRYFEALFDRYRSLPFEDSESLDERRRQAWAAMVAALETLSVYASANVLPLAVAVYNEMNVLTNKLSKGKAVETEDLHQFWPAGRSKIQELLNGIRHDLGVPAEEITAG